MQRSAVRLAAVALTVVGLGAVGAAFLGGQGGAERPGPPVGAGAAVSGSAAAAPRPASTSRAAASALAANPRKGLATTSAATVEGLRYGAVAAGEKALLARAQAGSGGLVTGFGAKGINVAGKPVGAVGSFRLAPGRQRSAMFEDQFVVQLVQAVSRGTAPPTALKLHGRVVVFSSGEVAVAGWFEGDQVVLVHRSGGTADLTDLALSVREKPSGR